MKRYAAIFTLVFLAAGLAHAQIDDAGRWGIGLDYDLPFKPQFDPKGPCVISSSSQLDNAGWDAQSGTLRAILSGQASDSGQLVVGWQPGRYAVAEIRPVIDGEPIANGHSHPMRRGDQEALAIDYVLRAPSTEIHIAFPAASSD